MARLQDRMVEYRAAHGMSQKDLANAVGVTLMTINQVEKGRQNPSKVTAAKIERIIGKEVTE
jgi:DNA-binding XRE family transcriptional regulator